MERKYIGQVAVDSGQLMIIDPASIEKHWKPENESKIVGFSVWGSGEDSACEFLVSKGMSVLRNDNHCVVQVKNTKMIPLINDLLKQFREEHTLNPDKTIMWNIITNSSYEEVCSITRNDERAGMLNDNLACAFQSGFGDGRYEVYAHYSVPDKKFVADKRISKVEIILIDE